MRIGLRTPIQSLYNQLVSASTSGDESAQRASGRHRRAALTGGTGVLARIVQVATSLITIPLTVHYLGNERFGLWMTISSVLAMANFADFGIGNGLINAVADAYGKDDKDQMRRAISSGFAVLSLVGGALLVFFVASSYWLSWADIFRVTSEQARTEAAPALLIFATCFALNIPLDIVQRVQLGLQQGFRMNLWQIGGSIMGLAGVIIGIHLHAGLSILVAALAGAPVVVVALNWLHFFAISHPELRPRLRFVSRQSISQIMSLGGLFFIVQVVIAVSFSADNFIIARVLGAASVATYSIPQRMFSLISIMAGTLLAPLWPAYGEAIARGDMTWVRRTLKGSLIVVFLGAAISSAVLLLIARPLIHWWVGGAIAPPFLLLLGLAFWVIEDCLGNTVGMFLNGASLLRFEVVNACIFGICCLSLKIFMTHRFGVVGVPWATLIAHITIIGIACAWYIPGALRRLHAGELTVRIATPAE